MKKRKNIFFSYKTITALAVILAVFLGIKLNQSLRPPQIHLKRTIVHARKKTHIKTLLKRDHVMLKDSAPERTPPTEDVDDLTAILFEDREVFPDKNFGKLRKLKGAIHLDWILEVQEKFNFTEEELKIFIEMSRERELALDHIYGAMRTKVNQAFGEDYEFSVTSEELEKERVAHEAHDKKLKELIGEGQFHEYEIFKHNFYDEEKEKYNLEFVFIPIR